MVYPRDPSNSQRIARVSGLRAVCFLWLLLSSASWCWAGDLAPELQKRIDGLCQKLEEKRKDYHIPGMALCVVQGDQVLVQRGFGQRDRKQGLLVDADTLFAIGSSTKSFASTLVAMLVAEGKMAWDDPVQKYLPYFELEDVEAAQQATIRDLLCHRVGLTRMGIVWAANQVDRERAIRQAAHAKPMAGFREAFLYNNVMYSAAGVASAKAADTRWETLLQKRILGPLGMTRSNATLSGLATDSNASKGYLWESDSKSWEEISRRDLAAIAPAGAMNSSARDMAQWLRFLLAKGKWQGKQLLSHEALEETWKHQIQIAGGVSYGLGWMLGQWEGRRVVEHGGNIDGYATTVGLLPDEKLGFALLTNVSASPLQQESLDLVWQELLGDLDQTAQSHGKPKSEEELQRYEGRYRIELMGVEATVEVRDGKLGIDIPGQMWFALHWPQADGRWVFEFSSDIQLKFDDEGAGDINKVTMYQQIEMTCPRSGDAGVAAAADLEFPAAGEAWTAAQMEPLLGKYHMAAMGVDFEILVQDERLAVNIPGQTTFALLWPDAQGRWVIEAAPDQALTLALGEDRRVSQMLFERDLVLEGQRVRPATNLDITLEELVKRGLEAAKAPKIPAGAGAKYTGTVDFVHQGVKGRFEAIVLGEDRMRLHLDMAPFGFVTTVVQGDDGWVHSNLEMSTDMNLEELELTKLSSPYFQGLDWREPFRECHLVRKDEFEGQEVYVVECVPHRASVITKYLDAETGVVVGEVIPMPVKGFGMTIPSVSRYEDYRTIDGVSIPYRATTRVEGLGDWVFQLESASFNEPVLEDVFKRPAF